MSSTSSDSTDFITACREMFGQWVRDYGLREIQADAYVLAPQFVMATDAIFVAIDLERRDGWLRAYVGRLTPSGEVPPSSEPAAGAVGRRWVEVVEMDSRSRWLRGPRPPGRLRNVEGTAELRAALDRLRQYVEHVLRPVFEGDLTALDRHA